jgi:hypothetical protein
VNERRSDLAHVTDILRVAGLVDARWFTEEGRARGSAIHLAARFLDEDDLDWESVEPDVLPRLRQYQRFLDEKKPEILAIEESVENVPLQYCGTLDRRVRFDGQEGIIDLKAPSKQAWQAIQLAGYAGCFTRPLKRWTLHLLDERYQLILHEDRNDWNVFKAALAVAAWKEAHGT